MQPIEDRLLPRHYFRLDPETYSIVKDRSMYGLFGAGLSGREPSNDANGDRGGADRDRTDDLRLAKPALSQLSYSPEDKTDNVIERSHTSSLTERQTYAGRPNSNVNAWARADLNCRPHAYQACALTT